jgi:hypothetical protein
MAVRHGVVLSSFVLGLTFACGGKTSIDPDGSGSQAPPEAGDGSSDGSKPGGGAEPGNGPTSGGSNPGIRFDDGDPLGACQEGFFEIEQPSRDCNCLVEGVCFDTKAQACACICPRNSSHNTCVSTRDCEKDSRTAVSCFAF